MKVAQRQFLVTVQGVRPFRDLPGYFAAKTGGNVSADTTKVWDGGSLTADVVSAPADVENITLTRPFDTTRRDPRQLMGGDHMILDYLRDKVGVYECSISVVVTDRMLRAVIPGARPTVYPSCLLTTLNEPEFDASSGDPTSLSLEFTIGHFNR